MPAMILVVATFHSLGIGWSPSGGGDAIACAVRYQVAGESTWHDALPLWYDARNGEYRGSLVQLAPGTTYTIELSLAGGETATTTASTWSETFPIARRVAIADTRSPFVITEGGTADGYVVYEGGTIDVHDVTDQPALAIQASYVIVHGVTTIGGDDGIRITGAHDVVIEESDVSGWGRIAADGYGEDEWAGVRCKRDESVERIVVQRNHIHHPRSNANSWGVVRDFTGSSHPLGPFGTHFDTCGGNNVFRYNEIDSDADHYFEDGISGADNFSDAGFARADSDIYGNRISQCWDDGIESEGANRNVRVWGNSTDHTLTCVAAATTSVGPLYVFRNVMGQTQYDPSVPRDSDDHGPFLKVGGQDGFFGGRIYVFHNTTTQPRDPTGVAMLGLGAGGGITDSGAPIVQQVVSRNNVFFLHKTWWDAIHDGMASTTNDFDYDLFNGGISAYAGAESHGIMGEPIFAADGLSLAPSSPGLDQGTRIPGFDDDFLGAAPDDGAQESGAPPLEFGVDAYRPMTMPETDAGTVIDASATTLDAGTHADAGVARPIASTSCGCGITRTRAPMVMLCALALAVLSRARRRHAP